MTKPTSASIRAEIAVATSAMHKASEDAALYDRLKSAGAERDRLAKHCNTLTAQLHETLAQEDRERREAQAACFRNLRIEAKPDLARPDSVIATTYIIRYEHLVYDANSRANYWTPREVRGFAALEQNAYAYLMQTKPDAIPHEIMALAPGDPFAAMQTYFTHMRRGYVRG